MNQEMRIDPAALQRLSESLNADLSAELDRLEAEGKNGSPKADQLLQELKSVAHFAQALRASVESPSVRPIPPNRLK